MDWLSQSTKFLKSDLDLFKFHHDESVETRTVLLREDDKVSVNLRMDILDTDRVR
jgi:hypothetical protein